MASPVVALKLDALWSERNRATDARVDEIDREMESLMVMTCSNGDRELIVSRAINARRARIQSAIDRRDNEVE